MANNRLQTPERTISETVAAITSTRTLTAAAELIGISRNALYERMNKFPAITEAVQRIKQNATITLLNGTERAADVIVAGMDDRRQMYDSAKYILDGMGVTKQQQTNVQVNVLNQIKKDKEVFDL